MQILAKYVDLIVEESETKIYLFFCDVVTSFVHLAVFSCL